MVTALASSADGATLVAGTMRGRCRYYTLVDKRLEYVRAVREGVGGGGVWKGSSWCCGREQAVEEGTRGMTARVDGRQSTLLGAASHPG